MSVEQTPNVSEGSVSFVNSQAEQSPGSLQGDNANNSDNGCVSDDGVLSVILGMPRRTRSLEELCTRSYPTKPPGIGSDALDGGQTVALDLETTGLDSHRDRIRLLSLAVDTIDGGTFTYLIDCFGVEPSGLWERLAEKDLIIHNAAFDLGFLAQKGFVAGKVTDTMLLAQVLAAGTNERSSLKACCGRYLGRTLQKDEQKSDWTGELTASQLSYAATDVEVLGPLAEVLIAKIREAQNGCSVAEL